MSFLEPVVRKLEVPNRVEAVTEGIRKGLISVEIPAAVLHPTRFFYLRRNIPTLAPITLLS
jgi:hypothetical protein